MILSLDTASQGTPVVQSSLREQAKLAPDSNRATLLSS